MPTPTKRCPGCEAELPLDAFRKDKNRPLGRDAYCRGCRREQTVQNRSRENARWNKRRKALGVAYAVRDPNKAKARREAKKAYPKPKKCIITGCANRGVRHHYKGYDPAHHKDIMWLCPKHHNLEHLLERARGRTGPSYFTTNHHQTLRGGLPVGAKVRVVKLHKVEQFNPEMQKYLGQEGLVSLKLPNEWNLGRFYRVEFAALPALAFLARELKEV